MADHYRTIKRYRGEALHRAMLGATQPDEYLSIAQDAVDATAEGIPKTLEFTKDEDNYKLKSKVMVNMHGDSVHFYVMPENVHGGPNESIESLQCTLGTMKRNRGKLSPNFALQVDNSWRECENTYLIGYQDHSALLLPVWPHP